MNIGEKLAALRRRRGLRQGDVAERLGVSRERVSAIERGGDEITVATLRRYCKEYGVSAAEVVDDS